MLTSGDVQFEPSAGAKILSFTNSIFLMTAGLFNSREKAAEEDNYAC